MYQYENRSEDCTAKEIEQWKRIQQNPFFNVNGFGIYDCSLLAHIVGDSYNVKPEAIKMFLEDPKIDITIVDHNSTKREGALVDGWLRSCKVEQVMPPVLKEAIQAYLNLAKQTCANIAIQRKNIVATKLMLMHSSSKYIRNIVKNLKGYINYKDPEGYGILHRICEDPKFNLNLLDYILKFFNSKKAKLHGWNIDMNIQDRNGFSPLDTGLYLAGKHYGLYGEIKKKDVIRNGIIWKYGGRCNKYNVDYSEAFKSKKSSAKV